MRHTAAGKAHAVGKSPSARQSPSSGSKSHTPASRAAQPNRTFTFKILHSSPVHAQREYRCPKGNIVFAKGKNIVQAAGLNIVTPQLPCLPLSQTGT